MTNSFSCLRNENGGNPSSKPFELPNGIHPALGVSQRKRPKKKILKQKKVRVQYVFDLPRVTNGAHELLLQHRVKCGLKQTKPPPVMKVTAIGTAAWKARKEYEPLWKKLKYFCIYLGDYDSALTLDWKLCPDTPYPVNSDSLCAFLDYFCLPSGSVITRHSDDTLVKSKDKQILRSVGTWHAPENCGRLHAAVKALHNLYNGLHSNITYTLPCSECIRLSTNRDTRVACSSCHDAYNRACTGYSGNALSSESIQKYFALRRNELKSDHISQGNVQLTPEEVRLLRTDLLSAGNFSTENLKIYTMIIVGISAFLRSDELLNLKVEDVSTELCGITPTKGVQSIVIKVKGKTDKRTQYLTLWANDEFPELCRVKHLLLHISISRTLSGFVFGDKDVELTKAGRCTTHMPYPEFFAIMKSLCVDTLRKDDRPGWYGTHILRKTGYLFAIFGVMRSNLPEVAKGGISINLISLSAIMRSARHTSMANAAKYVKDAITFYKALSRGDPTVFANNTVSVFMDIHIEQTQLFISAYVPTRNWQKPLPELATWYIQTYLRLVQDSTMNPFQLVTIVTRKIVPDPVVDEELDYGLLLSVMQDSLLVHTIGRSQEEKERFQSTVNLLKRKSSSASVPSTLQATSFPREVYTSRSARPISTPAASVATAGTSTGTVPPSKKRKYGPLQISIRTKAAWDSSPLSSGAAQCVDYSTMANELFCSSSRKFLSKWGKPLARCVASCHGGDVEAFAASGPCIRAKADTKYTCSGVCQQAVQVD